jgi:sec-independent protein translocase protein TatA
MLIKTGWGSFEFRHMARIPPDPIWYATRATLYTLLVWFALDKAAGFSVFNQGARESLRAKTDCRRKTMFSGLPQPMRLMVILVIVLIVFRPGKLPELGNSLGKAIRGFKNAINETENRQNDRAAGTSEESTRK